MQSKIDIFLTIFSLLLVQVAFTRASPHHDDLIKLPHIRMYELHEHHIFRLKGLIFGLFGIASVIIVGYLLYQYIVQELRSRRNHAGAAFSERGSLLPITEYGQQPAFYSRPIFVPLKSLRDYMGGIWGTAHHPSAPIPGSTVTLNRPNKYTIDPWENL